MAGCTLRDNETTVEGKVARCTERDNEIQYRDRWRTVLRGVMKLL